MNLKLSKTAIRELTRLYKGVLVAAIVATAVASTGAKAADVTAKAETNFSTITSATGTEVIGTVDLPTKTSDLTNDSGFQTSTQVSSAISTALANGSDAYQTASDVSSAIGAATTGMLTSSNYATTLDAVYAKTVDLPTKTSDLTNDSGFQTSTQVSSAISTALANSGDAYQTASDVATAIAGKADAATTYTKTEVDTALSSKVNVTDYTTAMTGVNASITSINTQLTGMYTKTETDTAISTAVAGKADAATTLAGYGITDAYTKGQVDTALAAKADAATTLAGYGITDAYTKTAVDTALAAKADAATTLAGYGITDAYTKGQVDTALAAKADAATTLAGYGITDAYTKTQTDSAISTATTLTAAGTSTAGLAIGDSVLSAIGDLDGALATAESNISTNTSNITTLQGDVTMDANATSSAVYVAGAKVDAAVAAIDVALKADETNIANNTAEITKLTDNTSTGVVNVAAANIGATGLTSAGDIKTTGSGSIISAGNITTTNGTISGKTGSFSGALTSDTLTVNNATTLKGTLDVTGNATVGGTTTLTGLLTANGGVTTGKVTLNGKDLTGVDVAGLAKGAAGVETDVATTASVKATIANQAEDATFTAATGAKNVATGTLNGAITSLDTAIGDRSTLNASGNGNLANNSDVATALKALDTFVGAKSTMIAGTNVGDSTTNLASAVNQLDVAIGNIAGLSTTNGNLSTTDVATSLTKIDTNMGALDTLTHEAFGATAPTNITAGLNSLATNIETATGGTFTDGAWKATVSAGTSNSYTYTESTNLMDAINQVASNIGTKAQLPDDVNGVKQTNTVNQNIKAINDTIGDMEDLESTFVATAHVGNAITNGGASTPTTVVAALNNIDATLGMIHGLKANGSNLGDNSNLADGTTVEEHLVALDDAIGNRNYTSTKYVSANSDLSTAVSALDSNLERVENKVDNLDRRVGKMHHEMKSGFASLAAMSALVPNARVAGDTQIAVGTGYYRGTTGFAVGAFHHINDNVLLNAGASYGGNGAAVFKGGVTFGF